MRNALEAARVIPLRQEGTLMARRIVKLRRDGLCASRRGSAMPRLRVSRLICLRKKPQNMAAISRRFGQHLLLALPPQHVSTSITLPAVEFFSAGQAVSTSAWEYDILCSGFSL